jgi:short-subunit dehydrogenase
MYNILSSNEFFAYSFKRIFIREVLMGNVYEDIVLVTGASSGIGKSIAAYLAKEGYRVYGTSRKKQPGNIKSEEVNTDSFPKIIQLDVCSIESIEAAVSYILKSEGRIDILINNAGFGIAGSIEDTDEEEAFRQFDTNFFGVHRMCRRVLPVMRCQGKGLIINVGSVAGLISIPFQGMYSASKYAVEAFTEALRIETRPFGIKVALVEPGDTRTGFTGSRQFAQASGDKSPYSANFKKSINKMIKDEMSGPDPEVVAKAVARLIKMRNPPVRVIVGFSYKTIGFLKRLIPSRLAQFIVSKLYS